MSPNQLSLTHWMKEGKTKIEIKILKIGEQSGIRTHATFVTRNLRIKVTLTWRHNHCQHIRYADINFDRETYTRPSVLKLNWHLIS